VSEGYGTFDHTGDLGLEVWAATPERLFELAAEALIAQMVTTTRTEPGGLARLDLEGDDADDLMVHWLNTVLLRFELDRVIWTRVRVDRFAEWALSASLEGPSLDPARDVRLREVKAVSHHSLQLTLRPGACRCRLVLDI